MNVPALHRLAMSKADEAVASKFKGDSVAAAAFFTEAYELEKEAAFLALKSDVAEPTRSILLRSAASLALDCQLPLEAEKLICTALMSGPPDVIADELRDLLEQVHFQRHLDLRGIKLASDEVQMSIAGEGVGFGMTPTELFTHRIINTENLIYRTAERKQNKPYRDAGRLDKKTKENVALYMSAPRAASFAVTFRIGQGNQLSLPGTSIGEEVVDELLDCLEIFISGDQRALKKKIPDEAYFNNFVGLARNIAPDGKDLSVVGFTIARAGKERRVAITRNEGILQISTLTGNKIVDVAEEDGSLITLVGHLKFADSRKEGKDSIQILDAENQTHKMTVPAGMMSDIVKPLWDVKVTAVARRKGQQMVLESIAAFDE